MSDDTNRRINSDGFSKMKASASDLFKAETAAKIAKAEYDIALAKHQGIMNQLSMDEKLDENEFIKNDGTIGIKKAQP